MTVVDSQVHIWPDGQDAPSGWSGGRSMHAKEMLAEMDAAGVDAAVIVPPGGEGGWNNAAAIQAAQAHPRRFAVMGVVPLVEGEPVDLSGRLSTPGVLGVRLSFAKEPARTVAMRGGIDWAWRSCEQEGLPVMVNAYGLLDPVVHAARTYPGLSLIVDHLGLGPEDARLPLTQRLAPLLQLARYPNVAVKASGLPGEVTEEYPFPSLHGGVRQVTGAFGAERVFWGSDISRLACSYEDVRRLFSEAIDLPEQDRKLILGDGIVQWLRWQELGK